MWAGVSAGGITAMAYLFESGLILPVFVSHLVYQQCADIPELPRGGGLRPFCGVVRFPI